MTDFTAFAHPYLAVACPQCGQAAGVHCIRPNGRRITSSHRARAMEADLVLARQHGPSARLRPARAGWQIEHHA